MGKVHGGRWLRLFLFEFFVILLGVLAAQGLQGWFADRNERRVALAATRTLDNNLRSLGLSAEIRDRTRACTLYRLQQIEAAIRERGVPVSSLSAPNEALVIDFGWNSDIAPLVAEHFDGATNDRYTNIALWADAFGRAQDAEQESWVRIGRLSGRFGAPTRDDYAAAKEGVSGAIAALRRVQFATINIRRNLAEAGLEPDLTGLEGNRRRPEPCDAAVGYTMEEHTKAARHGKLVTGEEFLPNLQE